MMKSSVCRVASSEFRSAGCGTRYWPFATCSGAWIGVLTLLALMTSLPSTAQDVHFSQFFNAPLVVNPANAGDIEGDQRFVLIHREQWNSTGSPFKTDAFSYDAPVLAGKLGGGRYLGVGLHAFSDRAGAARFGDTKADLSVSYALRGGRASLISFGMQGGYGQRSASFDGLRWDSQYNGAGYDPSLPTNETMPTSRRRFVDFGAGMLAKGELNNGILWKGGASVFHLTEPIVSLFGSNEDRLLRRFAAHGEMRIDVTVGSGYPSSSLPNKARAARST